MDDLAQALAHRITAPVTLSSLSALSSADLALAALRPDLPPLVRQRAYHAFAARRAAYHATPDNHEAHHIAGADDGHTSVDCTLSLSLSSLSFSPLVCVKDCIVRLELGMLEAGNEAFVKLREKVGQWAAKGGFEVRVVRADPMKNGITSPPASPPKNRVAKLAPPPPPPPPPPAAPADYEPRRLPNGPKQTRQLDSPSSSSAELDAEVWQFVSDRPAPVEWQPGFYARVFAFLSSLVPYDALSAPVFTPAEVALLSFAPSSDALPDLKGKRMRESTCARFENTERLALEYLYKSGPPITLETIRLVLLTRSYPALLLYVRKLSKVVLARDALVLACNHVLEGRLYLRRGDPTVVDPIEELISVVERIRDNIAYRKALFATSPSHLARKPLFSPS
ncbi:hypothetical protein JCM10296v2_006759 [Rhodotorula toruloides]